MLGLRAPTKIELENARHHDDRLRTMSVLEKGELQRLRAVDEKAAAQAALVLHHPMAVGVSTNPEKGGLRIGKL